MELRETKKELTLKSVVSDSDLAQDSSEKNVLCKHCGRTVENEIRCIGKCLADSEY